MLKWVNLRGLQGAIWGFGLVTCLGAFAAWVRLLPWMFAAEVPWRVIWPFARVLLAAGLELGLLIGIPLGWLSSWTLAVERGEVRGLLALGARPIALFRSGLLGLGGIGLLVASIAHLVSGPVEGAPTQVLSQMVTGAERHCAEHAGVADIPVAGMVAHCESGRLVGRIPGSAPGWFAVSELNRGELPTELFLGESELLVRASDAHWIHVGVGRATLRGFVSPPSAFRGWLRALGAVLAVAGSGLLLLPVIERPGSRWPLLLAVVGSLGTVVLLKALDQRAVPSVAYGALIVPPLLAWLFAMLLTARRVRRVSQ